MIDREDSFSQLTKISNNIFDEIIFKSLLFIEKYRNVVQPMNPVIVKPISFSMKTEDDLIDELNKLTDKNAPIAFLVESTIELLFSSQYLKFGLKSTKIKLFNMNLFFNNLLKTHK